MKPAHVVEIVTPKNVILNGLWFGNPKARNVIIWIHGLSSTVFSKHDLMEKLCTPSTSVLTFNNRGHDKVARIQFTNGKRTRGGAAHEVFTETADDLQGAVDFVKKHGVKRIFLAGHSTGCQKSVYWAAKKGKEVAGLILLAPISDYAATVMLDGKKKIAKALSYARKLIRAGKPHELLPESVWDWGLLADAQRFVSLYAGEGPEEVFTYWNSRIRPKTLSSIKLPIYVLVAEQDEYADRSAQEISDWFMRHIYEGEVIVVPKVPHSFQGGEAAAARSIKRWIYES